MEELVPTSTTLTSSTPHPSSSSYSTAEEDPLDISVNDGLTEMIPTFPDVSLTINQLQSRIKHLEENLAGKEAALLALNLELEAARDVSGVDASIGPLSFGSDPGYKVHLAEYLNKLEEYTTAIAQRDEIIQKLEYALKQRVTDQETQNKQVCYLTDLVQCLQCQLRTVGQHVQEPQNKLLASLKKKEEELQRKSAELTQCKARSADEVQSLMHLLEQLQQRELKAKMTSKTDTSQQIAKQVDCVRQLYESKIQQLQDEVDQVRKVETVLHSKLAESNRQCKDVTSDLCNMQLAHEAEVSSLKEELQKALYQYNKECEILKEESRTFQLDLHTALTQSSTLHAKVESLNAQLKEKLELCQEQKDEVLKLETRYSSEVSNYQESIEYYKSQLESLKLEFAETLTEKQASHSAEVTLWQEQITQLKEAHAEELSSLSLKMKMNEQKLSEELQSVKLLHENDICGAKQELQNLTKELREKTDLIVVQEQQICLYKQKLNSELQSCLELKGQIHALSQKLSDDKTEISSLKHQIYIMRGQSQEREQACQHHLQKISSLEQKLENKHGNPKEIEELLEISPNVCILEQKHNSSHKKEIDDAKREILACQQEQLQSFAENINDNSHDGEISPLKKSHEGEIDSIITFNCGINGSTDTSNLLAAASKIDTCKKLSLKNEDERCYDSYIQGKLTRTQKAEKMLSANETHLMTCASNFDESEQHSEICSNDLTKNKTLAISEEPSLVNLEDQTLLGENNGTAQYHLMCIKSDASLNHQDSHVSTSMKDMEELQNLCASYKHKINVLESELKSMLIANSLLKEKQKSTDNELCELKTEYTQCKNDFQEMIESLHKDIALKERELGSLAESKVEKQPLKDDIHDHNMQIKELLSLKSSLENKLSECHANYEEKISLYKEKVLLLEKELQENSKHLGYDAVVALVENCRCQLQVFKDFYLSVEDSQNIAAKSDPRNDETYSFELRKKSTSDVCKENYELVGKLKLDSHIGLQYLDKILKICEECLFKQTSSDEKLALHLSKSTILVEKLQLQLEEVTKQSFSLLEECEKLKGFCTVLEEKLRLSQSTPDETGYVLDCTVPSVCDKPAQDLFWIGLCYELGKKNELLTSELHCSQSKFEQLEMKMSSLTVSEQPTDLCKIWEEESFNALNDFEEQWNILQSKVSRLCTDFSTKEFCCFEKAKELIEDKFEVDVSVENFQVKVNSILDAASKSCKVMALQDQIQILELGRQSADLAINKQRLQVEKLLSCVKESWVENTSLQRDLHHALQERDVLNAKLNRVEAFYSSQKERIRTVELGLEKIMQVLESACESSSALNQEVSPKSKPKLPLGHHLEASIKVVSKMVTECESVLARSQNDGSGLSISSYLQSEGLTLRRLLASLQDCQSTLVNRSGPAMQVHVDFLNHQLLEKQSLHEDACNSLYALEAELRDLEDQKHQQEEVFLKDLKKHEIAVKYWHLKSELAETPFVVEQNLQWGSDNLLNIIDQLNTVYLKASSQLVAELDRTVSFREDQIRAEMAEQISALESKHKQQLADVIRHVQIERTCQDLEVLHQQELAAARAVHEYNLLEKVLEVRKELTASLDFPKFSPISVHNLCSQLIKHDIISQYTAVVRKIALNQYNEWEKQLSTLSSLGDLTVEGTACHVNAMDDQDDLIKHNIQPKSLCENLKTMYMTQLQSVLSSVEKEFNLMIKKLQESIENMQDLVTTAVLQEELKKSEEKHRLAVEGIIAKHTAEETKLRLMLSSAHVTKARNSEESSLITLRRELEEKHKREMEDLRTYFEQKCADFEKHYSEEVFSQHSRKMSDCSSASESEIASEMYYAGPGSAASLGPTVPPHLCDSLGESSFKEFEEHTHLEKLLRESREELESVKLALESRYEGELEAQREVYESKIEELLRNMGESHSAEIRLQSRRLRALEDTEKVLRSQLSSAEEEINLLKNKLESSKAANKVHHAQESLSSDLCNQVQCLTDALKKKESESSAQIASLKVKLRENSELLSKLEKEIVQLKAKHNEELGAANCLLSDRDSKIKELNLELLEYSSKEEVKYLDQPQEKDNHLDQKLHEQHSESPTKHKLLIHEEEFQNQQTISELKERYNSDLQEQKAALDAEYSEYLDFVKKCADETKMELIKSHAKELEELKCLHKQQFVELARKLRLPLAANGNEDSDEAQSLKSPSTFGKLLQDNDCYADLLQMVEKLQLMHESEIQALIDTHQKELQKKDQEQEARLDSVREECERHFHLQLEEARTDIVQALEHHIQQLLNEDNDGGEKPPELKQLEKKLASKYEAKIDEISKEHEKHITEMQKKHVAEVDAIQKRPGIPIISADELRNLQKERDCLRNVAALLRDVVAELVRYFMSCEDEFNSTLINELAKFEIDSNQELLSITNFEENSLLNEADTSKLLDTPGKKDLSVVIATPTRAHCSAVPKRVRFAPDVSNLLSFIDDDSILESVGLGTSSRDASLNFHDELDRCLARLRLESAALLEISKPPNVIPALTSGSEENDERKLHGQLEEMRHAKVQLSSRLSSCQRSMKQLQQDNEELQEELDALRQEREGLLAEIQRFSQVEVESHHHAEEVAEGYGEGEVDDSTSSSSPRATTVEELQDKARTLLLGTNDVMVSPNSSQQLPVVVDELCRDWDRLAEDARRKQEDLQRQIEAADKQLRSTRAFLDEQATEREQERDDFVREIQHLQEQLREKDRERNNHQQINREVEVLENQLRETQSALQDASSKLERIESEQKQAVEKIWTLRDIISDLEVQLASKSEEAAAIQAQNESLQHLLEQQGRTQFELAQEMEVLQHSAGNEVLSNRICQLEEDVRKHRLQAEQFGDLSLVQQIKSQLCDLEISLESRTKEMECAHTSTAAPVSPCLSSPSEDVSIRETLEAMRAATGDKSRSQVSSPITLPVDEVTRLQEQWQRHIRMDDAILKRVRDLVMHVDDTQAEKSELAKRFEEQMHVISSLEAKLDEHRCKFEAKLMEATTPLHSQIENLEAELYSHIETLDIKERKIKTLESALQQAELKLNKLEADIRKNLQAEHNSKIQLQNQISNLSAEKDKLQALLGERQDLHSSLPILVESMLADKNADIDRLERQVQELTKQVELSSQYVASPSSTLEFEYREEEKVRAHDELSPVLELKRSFSVTSSVLEKSHSKDLSPIAEISLPPLAETQSLTLNGEPSQLLVDVSPKHISVNDSEATIADNKSALNFVGSSSLFSVDSLSKYQELVESLKQNIEGKEKELADCLTQLSEKSAIIAKLDKRCKHLEECEMKLAEMSLLEKELTTVKEDLLCAVTSVNSDKDFFETQLKGKEAELQLMKDELHTSQDLIVHLQKKVLEAKQIAVSPNRSSSSNSQALQKLQMDLDISCQENNLLKERQCMINTEMEEQRKSITQLKTSLEHEQETVKSLKEIISKQNDVEHELLNTKEELAIMQDLAEKLQNEVKQLNTECITLKEQLHIPVSEAVSLASKLDAEKKFSKALQEELSMFKNKAQELEVECQNLSKCMRNFELASLESNRLTSVIEENESFQNEISQLKRYLDESYTDQSKATDLAKRHEQEVLQLKAENIKLGKALTEKRKILQNFHALETSKDALQNLLQERTDELKDSLKKTEVLSKHLSLLRSALKNIHHQREFPDLASEDCSIINNILKHIGSTTLLGGGDGTWQRLAPSEINVYEIRPDSSQFSDSGSLDDLTGMVQQELDLSDQLDHTLLQSLDPLAKKKDLSKSVKHSQVVGSEKAENLSKPEDKQISPKLSSFDREQLQSQLLSSQAELGKVKASAHYLQNQVELLNAKYEALQKQDSDLIEDLRIKLARALDTERDLHLQLHFHKNKVVHPSPLVHPMCSDKSVETSAVLSSDQNVMLQEQLQAVQIELETTKLKRDALDKQMRRLQEAEIRRSRKRATNEEQYRDQIGRLQLETSQECLMLRQQLSKVSEELKLTHQELVKERESQIVGKTPIVGKLKQMNEFLDELFEENRKMTKQMEQFTTEREALLAHSAHLEQQLRDKKGTAGGSYQFINMHSAAGDRNYLAGSDSELEDRVNHLFGRYLRSDSYRKALVWQKRYLLSVISGLSESQKSTHSSLSALVISHQQPQVKHLQPYQKFRSAGFAIIAIHRMHFMVDRWHRGRRIGCSAMLSEAFATEPSHPATHGRPFTPARDCLSLPADRLRSTLSQSPPTLERPRLSRGQSFTAQYSRVSTNNFVGTSSNLSEYVKQFDALNHWFDVVIAHPPK